MFEKAYLHLALCGPCGADVRNATGPAWPLSRSSGRPGERILRVQKGELNGESED